MRTKRTVPASKREPRLSRRPYVREAIMSKARGYLAKAKQCAV